MRLILSVLLAAAIVLAQPKKSDDEAALIAIEAKWDAATVKGDIAALDGIWADTFISTGPDGKMRTKAEMLARLKSGEVKYHSSKADDLKVYLYGSAAVVSGRWRGNFAEKGKTVEATERFTDMFIRQNGVWKAVASQASPIAK